MRLNGTENEDGTIWALQAVWDRAEAQKKDNNENCYRRYK